jgi:hypothetical protein
MLHCTKGGAMERAQLMGLYFRLQHDLLEAYTDPISSSGRIERLTDELAVVRRMAKTEPLGDEQSGDSTVPGIVAE